MSGAFPRVWPFLQVAGATAALIAVFCLGMWLTWPGFPYNPAGFPVNRTFVAVSLNGVPFNYERMPNLPTLEVRRTPLLRLRGRGNGGCNAWSGEVVLEGPSIAWRDVLLTALNCVASDIEGPYLRTLLKATRWRTEGGTLILEDDSNILRFQLAPSRGFGGR